MDEKHFEFLKQKSIDSFLLSLEIFNKPTIDYRLEGCVFFLCNAWELMLKAKLLEDGKTIYYPNTSRTYSLAESIKRVLTNHKDPVRVNLELINTLRNTATHDIIPEFELIYMPYLTFCVKAYADKMYDYFKVNVSKLIKGNFLSLFVSNERVDQSEILSKYGQDMKTIFDNRVSSIYEVHSNNPDSEIGVNVSINVARISNKNKADFTFYASNNNNDRNVMYIDRYVDPNQTHQLTFNGVLAEVDNSIKKNNIPFEPIRQPIPTEKNNDPKLFNSKCLQIFLKAFDIKNNEEYCKKIINGKQEVYKYSDKLVSFIITKIIEDKDVIIKNKKLTPGAKASRQSLTGTASPAESISS